MCKAFCTFRALSLRMSLVTAYMSRALCTAAEPDYDDEADWDADKDSASDLDMYMQLSEGEGAGWPDPDEARGRQLPSHCFSTRTPTPHHHRRSMRSHSRRHGGGGADIINGNCSLIYYGPCGPVFFWTMATIEAPGLSRSTRCWEKCRDPAFFVLYVLRMLAPMVSPASGEVVVRVKTVTGAVSV